ncbi:MAG: DUF4388 domain-containing protein [Chitinispirillaceae bacterium]|nr:DUF4388 domain-containing protein [Chitinispirillaceae bacterium]
MIHQQVVLFGSIGLCCGMGTALVIVLAIRASRGKKQSRSQYLTTFVFSGNLKQTTLLDAIQFLEIGQREGILHIYSGRRKGYLTFVKGQVVDAFYRNVAGREAIFRILELEEGDFYFEPKKISQPRLISDSIMDIAFEWDARKNEGGEDEDPQPADDQQSGEATHGSAP